MALISISEALSRWESSNADKTAITDDSGSVTRADLACRTNRLARVFADLGVTESSFVTIMLPNTAAYIEAALAALKLGATPQPVSSRLPKRELEAIVELANPSLIVGADDSDHPGHTTLSSGFVPDASVSPDPLPERIAKHWKAPTSGGSTGRPKLIVSGSPAQIDDSIAEFEPPFLLPKDGVVLVPGPLYHNAPFTFALQSLFFGNHVVIMNRFDPLRTLELIEREHALLVLLVPTMMSRIWKLPDAERERYDLSSLRFAFHMASHCPTWLKSAWIDWLGPERVCELYGGTEMQALTVLDGNEWLLHPGSVGKPVSGEIRILDDQGNQLSTGEVGDVYMRAVPGSPPTYFYIGAEPEAIDGWETIGDLGWLDDEGYLYLADRRTDLIVRGGANIYPAEVESAIDEHPAVKSSAVIGLPDDDLGQRVHAIVQTANQIAPGDLAEHLEERLARYKVPTSFEFVDELLRDDAGKTRRSALREARLPQN